jgi:hypothetical protein
MIYSADEREEFWEEKDLFSSIIVDRFCGLADSWPQKISASSPSIMAR